MANRKFAGPIAEDTSEELFRGFGVTGGVPGETVQTKKPVFLEPGGRGGRGGSNLARERQEREAERAAIVARQKPLSIQTEQALRQSVPLETRDLSAQQFSSRQSFAQQQQRVIQEDGIFRDPETGTIPGQTPSFDTGEIFIGPTIFSRQKGTIKDPETDAIVPVFDIFFTPGAASGTGLIPERPATLEEQELFISKSKSVDVGLDESIFGTLKTEFKKAGVRLDEVLEPVQKVETFVAERIKAPSIKELFLGETTSSKVRKEFQAGVFTGLLPSTKGELALTGLSAGFGGAIGASLRLGGAGLTKVAPAITPPVSKVLGAGAIVGGIGLAAPSVLEFGVTPSVERKGEVLGELTREVFAFERGFRGGSKLAGKAIGLARTRGLEEISAGEIIAPEFFEGQTFPKIRRKQTAQELLAEFKPLLPGETKAAGFTTAPAPLRGQEFGRGSSELPGLFQAPKISPRFLRIGKGESVKFNLDILGGGLPTTFRTTPTAFELTPLVRPRQTGLAPLKPTQEFFEVAPKGKSFVPFIKTEKESIIPFGTKFEKTDKRFFFEFEGERIPILEIKTLPGPTTTPGASRVTAQEFVSGRISSTASRPSVFGRPSVSSRKSGVSSIVSGFSFPSSARSASKSARQGFSSSLGKASSGFSSGLSSSLPSRPSRPSRGLLPPGSSRPSDPPIPSIIFQPSKVRGLLPRLPLIGAPLKKKKKLGKRRLARTPSLIALPSQLDIKAIASDVGGIGELTGLGVRGLRKRKKKSNSVSDILGF